MTVRKKGKTRGRPSKKELLLETLSNYWYKKYRKAADECMKDMLMYGTSVMELKYGKKDVTAKRIKIY